MEVIKTALYCKCWIYLPAAATAAAAVDRETDWWTDSQEAEGTLVSLVADIGSLWIQWKVVSLDFHNQCLTRNHVDLTFQQKVEFR